MPKPENRAPLWLANVLVGLIVLLGLVGIALLVLHGMTWALAA